MIKYKNKNHTQKRGEIIVLNFKKVTYGFSIVSLTGILTIPIMRVNANRISPKSNIIIANINSSSDTLSAYNIANKYGYNVILIDNHLELPKKVKNKYSKNAIIIGGPNTINDSLLHDITNHFQEVIRISGKDRYETNEKTIEFIKSYDNIENLF